MNKKIYLNKKEKKFINTIYPKTSLVDGSMFGTRLQKREYNYNLLRTQLKDLIESRGIKKINIGCGFDNFYKGWLNIGLFPKSKFKYGIITHVKGAYVLHFDMRLPLPLLCRSASTIYCGHFIEHMTYQEATELLTTTYKLLANNGIIRLTTPDLGLWIKKYYEDDGGFFKKFTQSYRAFPNLYSKGDILIAQAYGWNHKWLYDFESLRHLLEVAGFKKIYLKKYRESNIVGIKIIEPNSTGRKMESLCVEAIK